ncbi:acetyl-CoA C-acyltransferase [Gracilibacillus caseinilyticus]|uniref:acetyl-CoA C-acetyltransferase n=1 Tax=Gracilibacillus caseinilyticus TaxID=2932256 RepID=A0ABY4EYJ1_9BACI|nr:acetyl-CoA C-acyltransferase [Gracilibacillus caseinilyticus]UOQ48917.1 acetyl-CoA C-acyltransferase [Gracilibacillus caseinilyticus]
MSIVLVDGIRTPFGKWNGALSSYSATELASAPMKYLHEKYPELAPFDGVLLAEVIQAGQGQNPARQVAHAAGISSHTPAITLNNVCLGGVASVIDAARRILLQEGTTYIVGGFDSMSNAPFTVTKHSKKFGHQTMTDTLLHDGLWCSLSEQSMGALTEQANQKYGIGRTEQDHLAALSQQRAAFARSKGFLREEIIPFSDILEEDEGIREQTTAERLANLKPVFAEGGTITAGNASQMTDGASIGIVTSSEKAEALDLSPLATITGWTETAGPDASLQTKPADAIQKLLTAQKLSVDDIDLFEINEAFASVVIASCRALDLDLDKVNVNGGAIAIGHPLGGTGFRLILTLAKELQRRGGGKGIAALCGGGGQGIAILIEVPTKGE